MSVKVLKCNFNTVFNSGHLLSVKTDYEPKWKGLMKSPSLITVITCKSVAGGCQHSSPLMDRDADPSHLTQQVRNFMQQFVILKKNLDSWLTLAITMEINLICSEPSGGNALKTVLCTS